MRKQLVSGGQSGTVRAASSGRRASRLLWLCPALSLIFAALLLWVSGLTLWTAIVAGVLIGCPVAVAFALLAERFGNREGT